MGFQVEEIRAGSFWWVSPRDDDLPVLLSQSEGAAESGCSPFRH